MVFIKIYFYYIIARYSFIITDTDDLKKQKKNTKKTSFMPMKLNEITQNKQKYYANRKEKLMNANNNPNNLNSVKPKDIVRVKEVTKINSDDNVRRNLNTIEIKEYANIQVIKNINHGENSFKLNSNKLMYKDINGKIPNSKSSEKNSNLNTRAAISKENSNGKSKNNSVSNEIHIRNNSKESSSDRMNVKIPINMANIHSFNINVITQTVNSQVNNFVNTNLNTNNSNKNGSSNSLTNLNLNANILGKNQVNNLIQMKKKKHN